MTTHSMTCQNLSDFRPETCCDAAASLRLKVVILLACSIGMLSLVGCHRVPQVVNDDAVYKELDALYTAVTSKRRNLLDDCRERLTKLHTEGRLSDAGFTEVSAIVKVAENNEWSTAAQQLYDFMRAQRRNKT